MSNIRRCEYGCFSLDGASFECDHIKQSKPQWRADEPALEIVEDAMEAKHAELERRYWRYVDSHKRMTKAAQAVREWNADRMKHRSGGLGHSIDLGDQFPSDARRLLK
jgi:hypothetical protein